MNWIDVLVLIIFIVNVETLEERIKKLENIVSAEKKNEKT